MMSSYAEDLAPHRAAALDTRPSAALHDRCSTPRISPVSWSWSITPSPLMRRSISRPHSGQFPPCTNFRCRAAQDRIWLRASFRVGSVIADGPKDGFAQLLGATPHRLKHIDAHVFGGLPLRVVRMLIAHDHVQCPLSGDKVSFSVRAVLLL